MSDLCTLIDFSKKALAPTHLICPCKQLRGAAGVPEQHGLAFGEIFLLYQIDKPTHGPRGIYRADEDPLLLGQVFDGVKFKIARQGISGA